jgi:anti-sigma factor RsiW
MKSHDAEALSAYLDGQLSPPEARRLEQRIQSDSDLRELLADLAFGRSALKQVPRRRVPRNFVLRPSMGALRGPVPRSVPVLRFASVLATLLLVATFAINGLATRARATPAAAPMQAYGSGGVGGAAPSPEALLQSNAAQAPAEGQDTAATTSPPQTMPPTPPTAAQPVPKEGPLAAPRTLPRSAPTNAIPPIWQILLGAVAALSAGLAWYAFRASRRNFTSQYLEK